MTKKEKEVAEVLTKLLVDFDEVVAKIRKAIQTAIFFLRFDGGRVTGLDLIGKLEEESIEPDDELMQAYLQGGKERAIKLACDRFYAGLSEIQVLDLASFR